MGILFPCDEQFFSTENMEVFNNPSKRIRLDLSNNFDGNLPNDDLWGAEDLTAEEFDMLEVQATQSHKQDDAPITSLKPLLPVKIQPLSLPISSKEDESRQQLYELEGKVKILTQSLEKASSQLKEEKLKRDKIVNEKMMQCIVKENNLRKEIKKVESSLQFKNQEMKCLYEKVQFLEAQLQKKKETIHLPTAQTSNSFLEKFDFDASTSVHKLELNEENKPKSRKYKLLVDTPRGKIQGADTMSTLLCNRLSITPVQNQSPAITQAHHVLDSTTKPSPQLSAVSILRLGSDQQTEELFDYFSCVFRNHLKNLKSTKSVGSQLISPSALRRKESKLDKALVISCLKDLGFIISSSQFLPLIQKYRVGNKSSDQKTGVPGTSTANSFPIYKQNTDDHVQSIHSLLQSLVSLASPDSYPVNYLKNEEVELSLASLVSWSTLAPESFYVTEEIPYHSIMCCYEEPTPLLLSLKFMANLCIHKQFIPVLLHKDDFCLLCTISSITIQKISQNPSKYTNVMLIMEDLLSSLFTKHSFQELKLESSPCPTLVLQAIVISLLKFYETYQESWHDIILILKKGFALIEMLSRYLPNFKERRRSCEDSYIALVCGMLTLIKENPAFKEFYDLIHDLWDFQEDTSEFDFDEVLSEDSSQIIETVNQSAL